MTYGFYRFWQLCARFYRLEADFAVVELAATVIGDPLLYCVSSLPVAAAGVTGIAGGAFPQASWLHIFLNVIGYGISRNQSTRQKLLSELTLWPTPLWPVLLIWNNRCRLLTLLRESQTLAAVSKSILLMDIQQKKRERRPAVLW